MPWNSARVKAFLVLVVAASLVSIAILAMDVNELRRDIDIGDEAEDIAAVDIDDDGDVDLAVSTNKAIKIYRNVGGELEYWKSIENAGGPIVPVDFDGDGYPGFLLRNGQVWSSGADFVYRSGNGGRIAQDMDSDGDIDIIDLEGDELVIWKLSGDSYNKVNYTVGKNPRDVIVADVDHLAGLDIVVANGEAGIKTNATSLGDFNLTSLFAAQAMDQNSVSVFLETGGAWSRMDYRTGRDPVGVIAVDFDGDFLTDIITVNAGEDTLSFLEGKQLGGSFNPLNPIGSIASIVKEKVDYAIPHSPRKVITGDLDRDWNPDIAILCKPLVETDTIPAGGLTSVAIFGVPEPSDFNNPDEVEVHKSSRAIVAADLDDDGKQELITAGSYLTILSQGDGGYIEHTHWREPYMMAIPVALCGLGAAGVLYFGRK